MKEAEVGDGEDGDGRVACSFTLSLPRALSRSRALALSHSLSLTHTRTNTNTNTNTHTHTHTNTTHTHTHTHTHKRGMLPVKEAEVGDGENGDGRVACRDHRLQGRACFRHLRWKTKRKLTCWVRGANASTLRVSGSVVQRRSLPAGPRVLSPPALPDFTYIYRQMDR